MSLRAGKLAVVIGLSSMLLAGCGETTESNDDPEPATEAKPSPAAQANAETKVTRAAQNGANTPDRNIKGPRKVQTKCKLDGDQFACTATAYARPQATYTSSTAPFSVAIADEQWIVPVSVQGNLTKLGTPKLKNAPEIANFLEADDTENCTGGESLNC